MYGSWLRLLQNRAIKTFLAIFTTARKCHSKGKPSCDAPSGKIQATKKKKLFL